MKMPNKKNAGTQDKETRKSMGGKRPKSSIASAAPVEPEVKSSESRRSRPVTAERSSLPAVLLEFVHPEARQVYVAGSFNGWEPHKNPLQRAENGRWIGSLQVAPGRHEYLFVVDGKWLPDPKARETVENPFGGKNSVISVSA